MNQQGPVYVSPDPQDVEKNKVFAILSYISILWILPLICCPRSEFARYHANQGLLLFILSAIGGVCLEVVPFFGFLVGCVINLAVLVMMIMGIVHAAKGEMAPLPLIGSIRIL